MEGQGVQLWGPEAWQSRAVLGSGLARKGLRSVHSVCLGIPVVWAGLSRQFRALALGWAAWAGRPVLALLWRGLAACSLSAHCAPWEARTRPLSQRSLQHAWPAAGHMM